MLGISIVKQFSDVEKRFRPVKTAYLNNMLHNLPHSFVNKARLQAYRQRERLLRAFLKYRSIGKTELIHDIKVAIESGSGYATGKIGLSQKHWMYYEILLSRQRDHTAIRKFEDDLKFHALNQEGIFPDDLNFYLEFNRFYIGHVKNLDCLGLVYQPASMEMQLINYFSLKNKFIDYLLQEPDRSNGPCYLPYFKDQKLLLVCPFSGLLKERATKETFESVWGKTGKLWFYPRAVDFVEFPYGFAKATHERFPTVIDLFDSIVQQIERKSFDVALIAAGGLSIPIASTIKNMGKVAIDLGGHLQFLFGVVGKRWRTEENRKNIFTDSWIDMPEKYKPKETNVCDKGAYW